MFCAFSKNGDASTNAIFDKKPSATSGVSTTSYGHTTAQLQCAIGIEDITTSNSNTLYGSNHRLGIALKKGNNYSFLACPEDLVNNAALLDIDRFMIDSGELRDLTPGTYTAVGCLRIFDLQAASYKYIPLHPKDWSNAAGEKNSFQINVGGAEYYQVSTVGVGKEDTDTPAASCSSNSIAYITLRVKNISASQHLTTAHTYGDWACRAHIVGSYVDDNDVTTSLDFYLEPGIYSVDGVKSSESQVFTISPNATIDMMFMLNGVFGNSTAVSRIISGQVTVSPEMRFSGDPFISLYRPCTINFAR